MFMEASQTAENPKIVTQRVFIDDNTHQSFHIEEWTNGVITMGMTSKSIPESPTAIESALRNARETAKEWPSEKIERLRLEYMKSKQPPYTFLNHTLNILFEQEARKAKLETELTKHP